MPGNRALFDRAMEQSREAARQKNWDEALKQAMRALQEFPQDNDARSSIAVGLYNTGRYPQALQAFEDLRRSDANNPFFIDYLARVNEQLGNIPEAVNIYTQLADLQQSRRLGPRAAEALREVLRLDPEAEAHRTRLARLLEELGSTGEAAAEYLELARRLRARGSLEQAADMADIALRLDPNSREAKELIALLHDSLASAVNAAFATPEATGAAPALPRTPGGTGGLRGAQFAVDKIVALAQEHQEAGDTAGAIEQYERAISIGAERSDVYYSLGLLYQDRGEHQRAADVLVRAAQDSEYALSAHFALGSSYRALGQLAQAAHEYEQTIRLVDLQSVGKSESEDLIAMYENAAEIYIELSDGARAASLYSTLANFLQGKRWGRERAEEFRQKARELTERNMFAKLRTLGTGALTNQPPPEASAPPPPPDTRMPETWGKIKPITDFLRPVPTMDDSIGDVFAPEPPPPTSIDPLEAIDSLPAPAQPAFAPLTALATKGLDDVAERYVVASEKYIEQGLTLAAVDACMEVIRIDPDYLPIHLRLGEIYERDGRQEEALTKYQLLIDTYVARSEPQAAIPVYFRLIELSPDTINARSRLAELLKNDGRQADAAIQVGIVAGAYFRMGQTNKALEEYRRGLQWAPNDANLHAQYGLALLRLERYEAALVEFRRALELDQANLANVARINMALASIGDQPAAIWQSLATLLDQLPSHPQQMNDVQAEYRSALLVNDSPLLHYILGITQQSAEQHQSALLEFEQALAVLQQDPDPVLPDVLVHQAMADSLIALGQADEAREQLQFCLKAGKPPAAPEGARFPFSTPLTQGDIVRRMAEAYAAVGDLEGAERALQEAKQHLPYDRAIYTKLADIYFRQGKLAEALAQLDELATHYESRQDLDRALDALESAVKLAPNNIPIGSRLAKLYIRRGYLDKGIDGLVRVAEQQRREGQIKDAVANLQQAAEVYWTLGKQNEARALYDKIVQVAPNDIEARQWLSFMYTLAGRSAEAIAEKKQIVRLLLQMRDFDNAIAEMHQIYGLDQNDTDNLYQLGDALMRRQEYEQAVRIYSRLAKMPDVETERVEALQAAAKRMLDMQQSAKKG
jgi:tetratricopeptide (TPR) repeat protein